MGIPLSSLLSLVAWEAGREEEGPMMMEGRDLSQFQGQAFLLPLSQEGRRTEDHQDLVGSDWSGGTLHPSL